MKLGSFLRISSCCSARSHSLTFSVQQCLRRGLALLLFCVIPFSLDAVPFRLEWVEPDQSVITVSSFLDAKDSLECVEAGLTLEHRFLFKFCERINRFGVSCLGAKQVIHNLTYDAVQEAYRVDKDRLGDDEEGVRISLMNIEQAIEEATLVKQLSLFYVGGEEAYRRFQQDPSRWRLGSRVRTICRGQIPKFIADLSYYLSFGMVSLYGDDSGWEYFDLDVVSREQEPEHE
ncbi:hypothetical protein EBR25_01720 [bacterium]|nr:hypothetical protein [bacterium]